MSLDLKKWQDYGTIIDKFLHLNAFPLAIRLLEQDEEFPECHRPGKEFGFKIFLCQAIRMARQYGWTIGFNGEDNACQIAAPLLNWSKTPLDQNLNFLKQFMIGLYAKNTKVFETYLSSLSYLTKENNGLVISPLSWTKIEPTLVAIYCNPAQIMRLTQSYLYSDEKTGQIVSSSAGRAGTCHDGIVQTILTKQPRIVVPGNGDRVWGMTQDHEMLFTIPANKLEQVVSGLQETHKAGLRYPIPNYMRFKPGFQSDFQQRAIKRAGKTIVSQD